METEPPPALTVNEKKGTEPMAYDPYRPSATDQWDLMAQIALWQERAMHQAHRAEFYKRLSEATKSGTPIPVSDKEPAL